MKMEPIILPTLFEGEETGVLENTSEFKKKIKISKSKEKKKEGGRKGRRAAGAGNCDNRETLAVCGN